MLKFCSSGEGISTYFLILERTYKYVKLILNQPVTCWAAYGVQTMAKLCIEKPSILPHFNYCSVVWHFCKASDRRKMERTNERGLRVIFNLFNDWSLPYEDLFRRANMTTLYNRRLQDIAVFMYKIRNEILPRTLAELFNLQIII